MDRGYRDYDNSSSDVYNKKASRSFSMKGQKPPEVKLRSMLSKALTHFERAKDEESLMKCIREMWEVVDKAWQLPVIGRDLSYEIADTLRREKVVEFLISTLHFGDKHPGLRRECARLLSQILTTDNRHYVSKNALHVLTKYTRLRDDIDMIRINICILESLFKDSEATCTRLFDLGALDAVLHACRHDDLWTARYCSAALANAAVFGGAINHKRMVDKGAPNWIFPLALRSDDFCRFYACLAIAVLAANPAVEGAVIKSGTLSLVEPFVESHDPYEFAEANPSHAQGRSASFLQRLVPLLLCSCPEAQALSSFYFAMEASIKAKQQKIQDITRFMIFSEVFSIIPLKRVIATSRSTIARILATRCLKIIGEEVPRRLSPQIHLWDIEDVQSWLTIAGFRGFQGAFRASTVDGEMLLLLTERELKNDLGMLNNVHRKRFLRDLDHLRSGADYRSIDSTGIADWLRSIDPKFGQYTYRLVHVGIDKPFLPKLTDDHLHSDCEIENGIHRTKILAVAQGLSADSPNRGLQDQSDAHDVFISYRRNNGSHLASLLKVHLQLRGFRVFLDVDSLQEGDFTDRTLKSVKSVSAGFILILTAGALDKCAIDHEGTDWVHKEIVTAISNRRNIVPVTTETFQWPLPEDLPEDISPICYYNGVKWVHEYQDACVDKIIRFLRGQDPSTSNKLPRMMSMHSVRSGASTARKSQPHPNMPVRPSRSSDNLTDSRRVPRPRQRDSPPGQDSQGSVAPSSLPASRGVPGAQTENARSLDQGDGASAPQDHNVNQFKSAAITSPTKSADLPSSKKSSTRPSSVSTTVSSTSAVNHTPLLQKDVIKLDDVADIDQSISSESSTSDESSEYSTSDDEECVREEERGGADGKNKSDVKVTPGAAQTVVAQIENIPMREKDIEEEKTHTPNESAEVPTTGKKPKPSTKYKAPPPPPPHYEEAKHMPVPNKEETPTSIEPVDKPIAASRSAHNITGLDEKTAPSKSGSQASLPSRISDKKLKSPSALPKRNSTTSRSKSAQDLGSFFKGKKKPTEKPALSAKPQNESTTPIPKSKSENSSIANKTGKTPSAEDSTDSSRRTEEAARRDVRKSSADRTESVTSNSSEDQAKRTNADGNEKDTSENSARSTASSSTTSSVSSEESPVKSAKPVSNNANNNNANPKTNSGGKRNGSRLPTPTKSNLRTPISSSSSNSVGSPEILPTSAQQVRSPQRGQSMKAYPKRDGIPTKSYQHQPPKRSASEQLQLTRPPPPNYPLRNYPSGYQLQPNNHGYNMDHYKATMAASIRAPYPGHSPDVGMSPTRGAPSHGFDTAV